MKHGIYLDSAATTKPNYLSLETFNQINSDLWHNPNSTMYEAGISARRMLEDARKKIANCIGADSEQIIFTSGSTEGANTIIQGFVPRGRERDYAIIVSPIEHPAVWECVKHMSGYGVDSSVLNCDESGIVDLSHLEMLLEKYKYKDGILVCIMDSNNEIGCVQPTKDIARLVHSYDRARLFCDMTQSYAHSASYKVDDLDYDYACASAQKFEGLRGTGFLYIRQPSSIKPLIYGGGQERGIRSGTENVAGICSMAEVFAESCSTRQQTVMRLYDIRKRLMDDLSSIGGVIISPDDGLSNLVSVLFHGVSANNVISMLGTRGIMLSSGSACSTDKRSPSRILKSIGLSDDDAFSVLRISFSEQTHIAELDTFIRELKGVLNCLSTE